MTYEEFMKNRMAMKEEDQKKIDNYINLVNETTNAEREKRLNPEMDNYYNRRNFTDLLAE
jgi:flagellar biosynthesis regulator FlaF